MKTESEQRMRQGPRLHLALEALMGNLSTYALSLFIIAITVLAVLTWDRQLVVSKGAPLELRVIEAPSDFLSPQQALSQLQAVAPVLHRDTKLSEKPFWFSLTVEIPEGSAPMVVELPSRHALETTCWKADTLQLLGRAARYATHGAMSAVKGGFGLALEQVSGTVDVLCRASFVGPARISAALWTATRLQRDSLDFYRDSGLVDGGLIILSVFMLITALINRNRTYILIAAWLIVSLRMAALSAGWDIQWLGRMIPYEWLRHGRLFTVALYYTLTIELFKALFRDDLDKIGFTGLLRAAQWSSLPLLALSLVLPHGIFLPVYWTVASMLAAVIVFLLARTLMIAPSPAAMWYCASLGISLLGSIAELAGAAIGFKALSVSINSVTGALSTSLLAALAVAEQIRTSHKAQVEAQAELEHTYEAIPIGLFTLDMHGRFLSANPALVAMLGANVVSPGRNLWEQYFAEGSWGLLHRLVHQQSDGELEISSRKTPHRPELKRFLVKATLARGKIEGSLQDVTLKSKATEDLHFMANNDPLTKVFNRRGIEKILEDAMARLAVGKPLALAYLDLDRFKLINDLYGHAAGDEVLKQVCERVLDMLTGSQNIARVGGDEFVIVLPDTTIALAATICRGIVDRIGAESYRIGDKAFQVRGAIGLIEVSPGTPIKDALSAADRACRDAKAGHSDGLVVYEKSASAFRDRQSELDLVERLSTGVAPEGLFLEMQPIMSLKRPHDSLNFEVLLRMRDHDGSVIPGGRVVAAAENSGSIGVIDRWVMSNTLAWLRANVLLLPRTRFVCMNLSGASLNDERFVQDAFAMLAQNVRVADRLCIEITESVALHDLANTRRFIDRVRSYGVKVALDDFGAGYTSFSYLKELPADVVKIDGSFIVNINEHPANVAIVEAIVSLAMNLGMKTIAEWAEDNATVETLVELGVDYVQGYAVSRPQPPEKLLKAESSASFIQDEELARFVRTLPSSDAVAQNDLLDIVPHHGLH
jgi:diguanylate cyclase (GGDEF)-like protein